MRVSGEADLFFILKVFPLKTEGVPTGPAEFLHYPTGSDILNHFLACNLLIDLITEAVGTSETSVDFY
jgi:hypothetical protein